MANLLQQETGKTLRNLIAFYRQSHMHLKKDVLDVPFIISCINVLGEPYMCLPSS